MKHAKSLMLIALSLSICTAQTAVNKVSEPEALGVFFYVGPAAQVLKKLPQEDFMSHEKHHSHAGWAPIGGAYSTIQTYKDKIILEGTASPFRITEGKPTFIFRPFPTAGQNPEVGENIMHYKLMPCVIHKKEREYQLGNYKGKNFVPIRPIEVTVTKYGESSYSLTPDQPLAPGEYALLTTEKIFTFGIDNPGK